MPDFTPTEQRILNVLSDGKRHTMAELHGCLHDEMQAKTRVAQYIWLIRKKLEPLHERIVCEYSRGRYYYCHVRVLNPPD